MPDPTAASAVPLSEFISDAGGNPVGIDPEDPAGKDDIVTASLRIPAHRTVLLLLHSRDVIHDFFVRELRTKQDIVPGMEIPLELHVDTAGTYEIACARIVRPWPQPDAQLSDRDAPRRIRPMETSASIARSVRRRIFSTNHRVIARQYFFLSLAAVLTGTALSLVMRFHLIYPQAPFGGDVMTPEYYLSLLTLHGTLMVFFVLTLAPLNAFGNLVLPEQLGAAGMAFPRLNMISFWITAASFLVLIASFFAVGGGPLSGWTAYPPLSAVGAIAGPGEGLGQTLWFFSIGLFSIASLLTAINMIATVIDERGPGMTLMRMPLTCWNWFVTAILSLLAFSVLLAALLLILLDRLGGHQLLRSRRTARRRSDRSGTAAARLCSGSICSGSSDTPRFISRSCRAWESFRI